MARAADAETFTLPDVQPDVTLMDREALEHYALQVDALARCHVKRVESRADRIARFFTVLDALHPARFKRYRGAPARLLALLDTYCQTRYRLMQRLYWDTEAPQACTLNAHMVAVRANLALLGLSIETIPRLGWRLSDSDFSTLDSWLDQFALTGAVPDLLTPAEADHV